MSKDLARIMIEGRTMKMSVSLEICVVELALRQNFKICDFWLRTIKINRIFETYMVELVKYKKFETF